MKPWKLLSSLGLAVVVAGGWAVEASACSISPCGSPVRLFPQGHGIPVNLVHFKVTVPDPGPLELRAPDGTIVPSSIRMIGPDRVFAPDVPPAPDQELTLHYKPSCVPSPFPQPPDTERWTFRFRVRTAEPMDLVGITLILTERGIGGQRGQEYMFNRYDHWGPDRNGAAPHLQDDVWTIDGRRYGQTWYPNGVRSYCSPPRLDWLVDSCGGVGAPPPGKHLLEVKTRIVGIAEEFSAELMVDTSCDQVLRIAPPPPPRDGGMDAGTADAETADARTGDAGTADTSPLDAGTSPEAPRSDAGQVIPEPSGCSLHASSASAASWPSLGLLLIALATLGGRRLLRVRDPYR
jgi:hypothetical protein